MGLRKKTSLHNVQGAAVHVSGPSDQTYHRDGTDHGPTMPTVRDHRLRHVIVMFYPLETTVDLGPT